MADRASSSPFESLIPNDGAQSAPTVDPSTNPASDRVQQTRPMRAREPGPSDRGKAETDEKSTQSIQPANTDDTAAEDPAAPARVSKLVNAVIEGASEDADAADATAEIKYAKSEKTDDQAQADGGVTDVAVDATPTDVSSVIGPDKAPVAAPAQSAGDGHQAPAKEAARVDVTISALTPDAASADPSVSVKVAGAAVEKPVARTHHGKSDSSTESGANKTEASAAEKPDDTPDLQWSAQTTRSSNDTPKAHVELTESDKQAIANARGETPLNRDQAPSPGPKQPAISTDPLTPTHQPGNDVAQTLITATPTQHATAVSSVPAQSQNVPAAAVPLNGIAVAIASRAIEGKNRFEIRLDPPELGRIEVRLDVDKDGSVTSHLVAHRAETLDLLRRDAAGLQRALEDAGLRTADNGLQFSLRDQSSDQQQAQGNSRAGQLLIPDETLNPVEPLANGYAQLAQLRGGLDIRV